MLEKLLTKIHSGGPLEIRALANQLGTTPAMVKVMLAYLQQQGYIQSYQACDVVCSGCIFQEKCKTK